MGHLDPALARIILITKQDLNEPPHPNLVPADAYRRLQRDLRHSQEENDPPRHQTRKCYLLERGFQNHRFWHIHLSRKNR